MGSNRSHLPETSDFSTRWLLDKLLSTGTGILDGVELFPIYALEESGVPMRSLLCPWTQGCPVVNDDCDLAGSGILVGVSDSTKANLVNALTRGGRWEDSL